MSIILQKIKNFEGGNCLSSELEISQPSVAKLRENCMYIVTAVLIRDDKVLLISEAKQSCYGEWYLPAGKVEKKESLINAFKRELLEESFLEGEPDHLFSIQIRPGWYRFNFVGHETGGHLKTFEEKDGESLEAKWFPISQVLNEEINLRADDIISVIDDANVWLQQDASLNFERSLPIHNSYVHWCCRAIVVNIGASVSFAVNKGTGNIPIIPMSFMYESDVVKFYKKFGLDVKILGLIAVEHLPTDNSYDGLCWNVLCEIVGSINKIDFEWKNFDSNTCTIIKDIIGKDAFILIK